MFMFKKEFNDVNQLMLANNIYFVMFSKVEQPLPCLKWQVATCYDFILVYDF